MSTPQPQPNEPLLPNWVEDDDENTCRCERCGGDGFIEYLDGDGGDWGEDCEIGTDGPNEVTKEDAA